LPYCKDMWGNIAVYGRPAQQMRTLYFCPVSIFLYFPRLISAVADWMSTILPHMVWCGLSANLECRSEMYCTRLTEMQDAKNRHLGTIAQLCPAVSSQLRHLSTIGKKLLNSNTSSTCPDNMVNFGPLAAEIGSGFGAPLQILTDFTSWQRYCTAL